MPAGGFAFGPYQLDLRAKRLAREGAPLALTSRQFELLAALVSAAGTVISKDDLIRAAWHDVAVTDNSLAQAVSQLRMALDAAHPDRYIANVRGRGYRVVAPVAPIDQELTDADLDARLAPYRVLMDGRAALETLERGQIAEAQALFAHLVVRHSRHAGFHTGLANACALHYESTRVDLEPDTRALQLAMAHARMACRLDPDSGEAWATLGFVLARAGDRAEAVAALRHAADLEPDSWRHQLRLAEAGWGDVRLHAARRTLALIGESPLAYVLAATVYIARDRLAEAERDVDKGCAAMPAKATPPSHFAPVAVHWLKGLLRMARGADDEALAALEQELTLESRGHLYGTEICANTWYAIGALHLRRDDQPPARAAFEQAIARVPRHPMARVGLAIVSGERSPAWLSAAPASIDVAVARAALLVADGDVAGAMKVVHDGLTVAPAGNSGWLIPIEPLLRVWEHHEAWAPVLATLRDRAS